MSYKWVIIAGFVPCDSPWCHSPGPLPGWAIKPYPLSRACWRNEQLPFLCFDARLTGVTLIYLEVWNFDPSFFFFPLSLSFSLPLSSGFIFADIGSCHFATSRDVGDAQPRWQLLDSRHNPRRGGNITSGKVAECVNFMQRRFENEIFKIQCLLCFLTKL